MDFTSGKESAPPITKHEAAELLRVSIRTVDRLMAAGTLPHSKVGRSVRIQRSDIEALLEPSTDPALAGRDSSIADGGDAA